MRAPGQYVKIAGAAQLFTAGAAAKYLYSDVVQTRGVDEGTLSVLSVIALTTNTTTVTLSWQVSDDNSTWYDISPSNNAANVTAATGTGTLATTNKALEAPAGVYGWNFVRLRAATGVSTADGTTDGVTFSTRYLKDRW